MILVTAVGSLGAKVRKQVVEEQRILYRVSRF